MLKCASFSFSIFYTEQDTPKFFDDDGTEIRPDLIPKPDLCVTCKKDGKSGEEDILCSLTRADQQGEARFICEAYEPRGIERWREFMYEERFYFQQANNDEGSFIAC